jgi:hypothetical protein
MAEKAGEALFFFLGGEQLCKPPVEPLRTVYVLVLIPDRTTVGRQVQGLTGNGLRKGGCMTWAPGWFVGEKR